jgi:NADH:ubiquinone oxidoreductase subunit 6 (subunit J)
VNFACIAFFFLMLNAPFLAMVQITVYAGAIMVLFLFVIMLLGAERVMPTTEPRFRWLTPVMIGLVLLFVVVASVAIIDGKVDQTEPQRLDPQVRVVNVLDGVPAVDVYLDNAPVARGVKFQKHTAFKVYDEGRYTLSLFAAGADPQADTPLTPPQQLDLTRGEALTFAAVGRPAEVALVVVRQSTEFHDENKTLRLVAINGLPERAQVDVLDKDDDNRALIEHLAYGQSAEIELDEGTYSLGLYPEGNHRSEITSLKDVKLDSNTMVLLVFAEQQQSDNSFRNVILNLENNATPSFGGPTHVGQLLFSRYVLPFEMVGLLLLVAMVGAIVLTHEAQAPRRSAVRRLANPPAGYEQPARDEG